MVTHKFLSPLVGAHREQPRRRPRVGRPPDRLRHTVLDLKRRWDARNGHGPCPGGPVGHHLAEEERPPPERYNSSGLVLLKDFQQGDLDSSKAP
jgi:hypothetical protein